MICIYKVAFRMSSWVRTASKECLVITDTTLRVPSIIEDRMEPEPGESVIILGICIENDNIVTYLDEEMKT